MELKQYIENFKKLKFKWGEVDCYRFIRGYIDLKFPNNKLPILDYQGKSEALLLNKKYNWFEEIEKTFKYEIIDCMNHLEDGDLLILKDGFQCIHIVSENQVWSIDIHFNLVGLPLYKGKYLRLLESL